VIPTTLCAIPAPANSAWQLIFDNQSAKTGFRKNRETKKSRLARLRKTTTSRKNFEWSALEKPLRRFRIRRPPEKFSEFPPLPPSAFRVGISAADSPFRLCSGSRPQTASTWSWRRDLNPRPPDYKSGALPTELRQHSGPTALPGTSIPLIPSKCPGQFITLPQGQKWRNRSLLVGDVALFAKTERNVTETRGATLRTPRHADALRALCRGSKAQGFRHSPTD
jgi:hypothetical protein